MGWLTRDGKPDVEVCGRLDLAWVVCTLDIWIDVLHRLGRGMELQQQLLSIPTLLNSVLLEACFSCHFACCQQQHCRKMNDTLVRFAAESRVLPQTAIFPFLQVHTSEDHTCNHSTPSPSALTPLPTA
jgi:hypothetical protein